MERTSIRLGLGALILWALAACESAALIDLNNSFVELSRQTAAAEQRLAKNELDATTYDSAIEVNRVAFAEIGDRAAEAADDADSPQNKVSLLNLAVRSYLKSGPVGDAKIPDLAQQGIDECTGEALQGLNALPVTCGYFHVVTPQAVSNEALRKLAELSRKAKQNRKASPRKRLTAEQGKELQSAIQQFLAQIARIDKARAKVDLTEAGEAFKAVFQRQKIIFYCNARDARLLMDDVVKTGPGWNRAQVKSETRKGLTRTAKELDVTSPAQTCAT